MKVFAVVHCFDMDGGFGDAVSCQRTVYVFTKCKDAERFVKKYNDPHCYARPYTELWCGKLKIKEIDVVTHAEFDLTKQTFDSESYC